MAEFNQIPFGDLAEFRNGLNFSADQYGSGVKFIGVADFKDYFVPQYDQLGEIVSSDLIKKSNLLNDGDILFVRSNGNKNLVGRSMYIKNLKEDVVYSGFCIRARPYPDKINSLYLAYFCKSDAFRQRVANAAGGANIQNLSQPVLAKCPIPVPSPEIQERITQILSAYDDLIENNEKQIMLLKEMVQITYEEWFVRFRFRGHESVKIDSKTGLPEGWKIREVGSFGKLKGGKQLSKEKFLGDGPIPVFGGAGIMGKTNVSNASGYVISVGRVGAYCGNFVAYRGDAWINNNASFFELNPDTKPEWFFVSLRNLDLDNIRRGAAQPFVSNGDIEKLGITYSGDDITNAFQEALLPRVHLIEAYESKNRLLREARDILLPRLMTGVIDVESYDPAQFLKEAA